MQRDVFFLPFLLQAEHNEKLAEGGERLGKMDETF